MSLLTIAIVLIIVGMLLWVVNRFIPMAHSIKLILNAVVIIGVIIWLLSAFGIVTGLPQINLK